jgi:HPt (histidine-containing phosphotransfer) domain-containing protein
VEAGDPVFAALCASASITMLNLVGTPLDRMVAAVDGWGALLRGDGGVAANAANIVNIGGKLTRGEPITSDDLDRVTHVPLAAGPMRNNAIVNLGLALTVIGHEPQVRAWLDEIRGSFSQVNFSQPHIMTLWLLDGLFAAKDVRSGRLERRHDVEHILRTFRDLRVGTGATNNDPAIAVIEAQLARADGDLDRAAGLFGRAAREAHDRDLTPIVAYASEERARMLDDAGCHREATLFYREAVIAYRRWAHMTKVAELEQAHPELRVRGFARADDKRTVGRRTTSSIATLGSGQALNDQMDLATVLKVSQDISTQLTGSGVVRAVLTGIAQNAGAERVVLVLRAATGIETVYGEVHGATYRDIGVALDDYDALPKSVVRVVRRTGRPLVVADATSDPNHAADPFVIESRGRSIAGVPIRRKGELTGFVVLENRMVAGAFTPQLVSLTQALVAQAAISLDNASLYETLENRVNERTAALNTRNTEMRMVLDHVAQGLAIVGTDGRLFAERSAILGTWFPQGVPDTLAGWFANDPAAAAWFHVAWEQLVEGIMPLPLCIQQLPAQLRRGDRVLAFDWQPIADEAGRLERMLVVLSDVTEALRRVETEREQKQLMAIFENLSEDRAGVVEFLREATAIVGELATGTTTPEAEKRLLHTLKGNASIFGLSVLAARCHEIEDAMALDGRRMTDDQRHALEAAWRALDHKLSRFIDVGDGFVQVRKAELDTVLAALRRDDHPSAHDVELWSLESLRVRFQRIGDQARVLAARLGKDPVRVCIDDGAVHIDSNAWMPFWSAFVHVVRNSIDHGIEPAEERARLGKGAGTLTLRSYLRADRLVFEFSDDGRGIVWDSVRDKARAAGLPTETRSDLVAALFHDGVSTLSNASEVSGRGVGLGAVAEVCRTMGCEITVESLPGQGMTMRFELPGTLARGRRETCERQLASASRTPRALTATGSPVASG